MNKKLEDYKLKNAKDSWATTAFQAGFDAAIALELPVKFGEWVKGWPFGFKQKELVWDITNKLGTSSPTISQLYTYYIENIWDIKK